MNKSLIDSLMFNIKDKYSDLFLIDSFIYLSKYVSTYLNTYWVLNFPLIN